MDERAVQELFEKWVRQDSADVPENMVEGRYLAKRKDGTYVHPTTQIEFRAVSGVLASLSLLEGREELSLRQRITDWHLETFGPNCEERFRGLSMKFREEANELILEVSEEEAADLWIVCQATIGRLEKMAEVHGFDLTHAAERKFQVVKNRDQRARDIERGIPCSALSSPTNEQEGDKRD